MEYPEIIIDTNVFIEHQRKQNKKNSKLTRLVKNKLPLATLNVKHFVDFIDIELVPMGLD